MYKGLNLKKGDRQVSKTHKIPDIKLDMGDMHLHVDMGRIEKNLNNAQTALDFAVMTSMEPYMPMQTGTFISRTRAESTAMAGTGRVCAAASPYGKFLYEGKTMVDEKTGSPYARYGATKVLVSQFGGKTAARPELQFERVEATPHWFETAKKNHGEEWIKIVKRELGEK